MCMAKTQQSTPLEARAAARLGKEAGLLVVSGSMANLVSVLTHCGRGDEVILGDKAHTFVYEAGGIAALGSIHPHTVPVQPDGTLPLDALEKCDPARQPAFPAYAPDRARKHAGHGRRYPPQQGVYRRCGSPGP